MSNYQSLTNQFQYNLKVAQEEGYSWRRVQNTKDKQVHEPVMLWRDEYEKNPKKLFDKLRQISDYMLLNPHPLFDSNNPNQPYLRDVVRGKLRMEDYYAFDRLFGDEGPVETKDNHFFHPVKSALVGKVLQHPFQFAAKQISTAFAEKKIVDNSTAGAKMALQALIAAGEAEGDPALARFKDPKVKPPKDENELLEYQTGQEQVEGIMYNILQHIDYQHSFQNLGEKCYGDQFDINAEFAWANVLNGEVIPEYLRADQVSWIANRPIETFEDRAVLAVGIEDYPTISELINEEGTRLNIGTGVKSLLSYIEGLEKGARIGYDPYNLGYQTGEWSEWFRSSDYKNDKYGYDYTSKQVNWMRQCFYPYQKYGSALQLSVLRHRFWFKMIRHQRYKVLRDGKPAKEKDFQTWKKTNFDRKIKLSFELVEKGESTTGHLVKELATSELWSAKRIGHDTFIDVGRYEYQAEKEGQANYVGWPVVAQISREKSFAKLGEQTAIRTNVLYNRADALLADVGLTSALVVDRAMGGEPMTFLYNAKKSGVLEIDSTKYINGNNAQLKHLTIEKLGDNLGEMTNILRAIREEKMYWEAMIGVSGQVQGQSEKYSGLKETQLNISNQQVLTIKSTWMHQQFMNQLLTRCADVAKFAYAMDGNKAVMLTTGERKVLKLTSELALADFDIFLESGTDLQNQMEWILKTASEIAASGGASFASVLFEIGTTKNPARAIGLTRKMTADIQRAQQEASQAAQQQAQAQMEFEMQKMNLELEKVKIQGQTAITIQQMKNDEGRKKADDKGTLADVKEENEPGRKVLESQLRREEAELQASLQNQPETVE